MNFFSRKTFNPEKEYVVLPGAKERALAESMNTKKKVRKVPNLKKDISQYMDKHQFDELDRRPLARKFTFKAIE